MIWLNWLAVKTSLKCRWKDKRDVLGGFQRAQRCLGKSKRSLASNTDRVCSSPTLARSLFEDKSWFCSLWCILKAMGGNLRQGLLFFHRRLWFVVDLVMYYRRERRCIQNVRRLIPQWREKIWLLEETIFFVFWQPGKMPRTIWCLWHHRDLACKSSLTTRRLELVKTGFCVNVTCSVFLMISSEKKKQKTWVWCSNYFPSAALLLFHVLVLTGCMTVSQLYLSSRSPQPKWKLLLLDWQFQLIVSFS